MQDLYNTITAKCFNKCVSKPGERLDKGELSSANLLWFARLQDFAVSKTLYQDFDVVGKSAKFFSLLRLFMYASDEQTCLAKCVDRFLDSRGVSSMPYCTLLCSRRHPLFKHLFCLAKFRLLPQRIYSHFTVRQVVTKAMLDRGSRK